MNKKIVLNVVILLLVFFGLINATTWYVHPDSALNTIQAGLDSCSTNDTVLVGPGIYYENLWWPGTHGINLISEFGPDTTIIDGQSSYRVIQINFIGVDSLGLIDGFTVRNGRLDDGNGVGILCLADQFTISNNIITNNYGVGSWGAGIACFAYGGLNIAVNIMNNIITNNYCGNGGGIYCKWSRNIKIINNTITGNRGGGISCQGGDSIIIRGNIIAGNTGVYNGGGIMCAYNASPLIIDNIIIFNDLENPLLYGNAGIALWQNCNAYIESCTISNNYGHGVGSVHGSNPILHYNNIMNNAGYGVRNEDSTITINAEYNWWGDASGPYHPDSNPGGLGDSVSDWVDFIPWLTDSVGAVAEEVVVNPIRNSFSGATIFSGPLLLPEGKKCKVYDVTGRTVIPDKIRPGIYFVEIDGQIIRKVVKVR